MILAGAPALESAHGSCLTGSREALTHEVGIVIISERVPKAGKRRTVAGDSGAASGICDVDIRQFERRFVGAGDSQVERIVDVNDLRRRSSWHHSVADHDRAGTVRRVTNYLRGAAGNGYVARCGTLDSAAALISRAIDGDGECVGARDRCFVEPIERGRRASEYVHVGGQAHGAE